MKSAVLYPESTRTVAQVFAQDGAYGIWGSYIKYIGAGALAAGRKGYLSHMG